MPYVMDWIISERDPYSMFEIPSDEIRAEGGGGWFNVLGGPVLPADQPTRPLRAIKTSKKRDPDLTYAHGGYPCVTNRVKTIIENFEPGKHQFFPVEFYSRGGKLLETGRYMLNITTMVDAIVDGPCIQDHPDDPPLYFFRTGPLTVRAKDIAGLHLWRDRNTAPRVIFMSTQLFNALNGAKCLRVNARPLNLA